MRNCFAISLFSAWVGVTGSVAFAADRPAPAYFLDVVMASSTAQQLALACPSISVDVIVVAKASGEVMTQLETDGFDTTTDSLGMTDTSDAFAARQDAFLARHDLQDGATADVVCAAARAEMAQGTLIGSYLMEAPE